MPSPSAPQGSKPTSHTSMNTLIVLASLIIIVTGLHYAAPIIIPFLLAIFIAILCTPAQTILINRGLPVSISVFIVLSLLLLSTILLVAFVGTSMNEFFIQLPNYQQQLQQKSGLLLEHLQTLGLVLPNNTLADFLKPETAMTVAANTFKKLSAALTNFFLISLTIVFILLEASTFKHKMHLAIHNGEESVITFQKFMQSVNHYIAIKSFFSLLTGIIVAIGLSLIGVNHPLLWGLLAFLLNFIPNIGSILASIPAILLAFIQLGFGSTIAVIVLYLMVNTVIGSILEPKYMGKGLGLSTLVVFISLIFWGAIFGPIGMLLSIPLTMILKLAFEHNEETQWLAILLGSGEAAKSELQQSTQES